MSNVETETRTYFGDSLEDLLPKIRSELGPDALIVRQREGVVGGVGGFFGRKCVEVEARPGLVRSMLPPRLVVDAYDTGDPWEALAAEPDLQAQPDNDDGEASAGGNGLLATLLAQTSPFAEQLSSAIGDDLDATGATTDDASAARSGAAPSEPATPPGNRPAAPATPISLDELAAIRAELVAAAVPVRLAGEIVGEVERALRPFEPGVPVRDLARRALASRIRVSGGWRSKRRTIALVGLHRSGRTLAAAGLCAAYVRDGRTVAAVSLEPARAAMRLADLTSADDVAFHVADAPDLASRVRKLMAEMEVVVADTPPLADAIDGNRLAATLELLGALQPDETHLVLPATAAADDARTLVESLAAHRLPSRLIVSYTDAAGASGVPVGLALTHRIPVSFVCSGPGIGALHPAAPEALARLVLQ